jgi:hypothetical protein
MWFKTTMITCCFTLLLFLDSSVGKIFAAMESTSSYQLLEKRDSILEQYTNFEKYKAIYALHNLNEKYDLYVFDDGCFNIKKCFTLIIYNGEPKNIILEAFLYNKSVKSGSIIDAFGIRFGLIRFIQDDKKSQSILLSAERVIVYGED